MKVQFLTDDKGQPSGVFLTMKQYKKLLAELEKLDAIRAYDRAKQHKSATRPFREFLQDL
jgi:hypothetical protein